MQKIQNQILSHISNNEVRSYIQKNIFSTEALHKQRNAFVGNFDSIHQINSSSMFSSYMPKNTQISEKMSIKTLVSKIQKMIVLNGFYKNIQDIKELKKKTFQLNKQNQELQYKLNELKKSKIQQQVNRNQDHIQRYRNPSYSNFSQSKYQESTKQSGLNEIMSYDQKIKQVKQKLQYEKIRQSLIQIVKLSKQDKNKLLQQTRRQYQSLKKHIDSLQRVIANVQKGYPDESWLKVELEQLQKELDQKSMLVGNPQRLTVEIQLLQRKVQLLQMQRNELPGFHKLSSQKHTQTQQKYQNQQVLQYEKRLQELEIFMQEEAKQKQLLLNDIKQFNNKFDKEKNKNAKLLKRIKDNFYSSPEIIDYILKAKQNSAQDVNFLLNAMELKLQ